MNPHESGPPRPGVENEPTQEVTAAPVVSEQPGRSGQVLLGPDTTGQVDLRAAVLDLAQRLEDWAGGPEAEAWAALSPGPLEVAGRAQAFRDVAVELRRMLANPTAEAPRREDDAIEVMLQQRDKGGGDGE